MTGIDPSHVSAIVVTRGDVDLTEIIESLRPVRFLEVIVWSNHPPAHPTELGPHERIIVPELDLAVYGRYAAIKECSYGSKAVYVQDDDCLCPAAEVVARYEPNRIVANMPRSRWDDYPDSCLVGWGAVFDADLPTMAWGRFASPEGGFPSETFLRAITEQPEPFRRECDVVFTTLTPHVKVDLGFQHLPWAEDPERAMFLRPWRKAERDRMYEIARASR